MSSATKKPSRSEKTKTQPASSSLQGWPGYRTREGRSGLDPLDSPAEEGHMLGVFIHRLLTGNLRTKNPFYLVLLAIMEVIFIAPFLLAIAEAYQGDLLPIGAWLVITIPCLLGVAMLVNLIKDLIKN